MGEQQNKPSRIKCGQCGDVIQSHYTHDWWSCTCGAIFIDGGTDYTRIGGADWKFTDEEETKRRTENEER